MNLWNDVLKVVHEANREISLSVWVGLQAKSIVQLRESVGDFRDQIDGLVIEETEG